ncbi:MAG TPA: autoinducer binding domain-containing protein [Roseateles sp.]|uniref:autoinducer binding domain-containing protein n=1 Tax=Roseateles sp. TaxID=1971397 RepID=UPI002EDB0B4A
MLTYQDLVDVGQSPDAETLQSRLVKAARQLGYGLSGGTLIRGRLASGKALVRSFGNHPDAFAESFKSFDLSIRDPLLTAMQATQGCHVYDQGFYVASGAGELWELIAPHGYRHGMAISIHEFSHAETFCFGVDSLDPIPNGVERLRLQSHLQLLAQHAHAAAKRIHLPSPAVDLNAVTKGEVEALKWAADAQSVSLRRGRVVIASQGQVQGKVMAKLQATSAPMAVLRAIEGGLIDG